jgi:hypothetical protein
VKTLLALVLIAVVAMGALQFRANSVLQRDVALLREEVRSSAAQHRVSAVAPVTEGAPRAMPTESQVSGMHSADLTALREEIAALRKSTQSLTQLAVAAQAGAALKNMSDAASSVATQLVPSAAWKNAGKGTPEAATETVLWAALGGDVDTLSNSVVFTPTAREKAEAWFATLPESTRQQYGSAEKVVALMIAKDAATLSGMQVLGSKEITPDNVGVRIRFASSEGKTKDDNFLMQRGNDGWRLVLPDSTVEKFARQLSGKK